MSTDRFTTIPCPHCQTSIYVWFVKTNGHCPSCQKEVNITDKDEANGDSIAIKQPRPLVPVLRNAFSEEDILSDNDPSRP
jgi:endogenous inhibitor of DNA gyrase (YacG/DUF329 family)